MTVLAVTVVGHDRPGIIADVTGVLAGLDGNLEDSSMTLLRGTFAMTLVVRTSASVEEVRDALAPDLASHGLDVTVRELTTDVVAPSDGIGYVLSVHGADRAGIVSAITSVIARHDGNITDLTTRLAGDLYILVAEVELPPTTDAAALEAALAETAADLGVDATLRQAESDLL